MIFVIIFACCIAIEFLCCAVISMIEGENKQALVYLITVLITGLFITVFIISIHNNTPERRNATLLQNIEKANKEYEKFLIDYPEFREEGK